MTRVIYFFHSWSVGQSFSSRSTCCLLPRWTAWMSYKSTEPGTQGGNYTASAFNLAQLCTLEIESGPFPSEHLLGQYPISCQNELIKSSAGIRPKTYNNYQKLIKKLKS